jgi:hypothetical protein
MLRETSLRALYRNLYSDRRRFPGNAAADDLAHGVLCLAGMKQANATERKLERRRETAQRRSRAQAYYLRARYRRLARQAEVNGRRHATLLALVQEIQKRVENDADVVRLVRWMVNSGAVTLSGNFADQRF